MSLKQKIENASQQISKGISPDTVLQVLRPISKITTSQYQANQSSVIEPLTDLFDTLKRNSLQFNSGNIANYIESMVKVIQIKLPLSLKRRFNSTIKSLSNDLKRAEFNNKVIDYKNEQVEKIEQQMMKQAIQQNDITYINVNEPKPVKSLTIQNQTLTPIQRQIDQFKSLLNPQSIPQITSVQRIPSSVRFLSEYAKIQNKIPIGSISDSQGQCFVGIQQIQQGQQKIYLPMQKNQIPETKIPDLENQFKYHANKTINSWNKFIQNEANMIGFVKKISSAEDRRQYVEKNLRYLNFQQFSAEALASISYYYLYLPIQRFLKNVYPYKGGSQGVFFENYTVMSDPKLNPLIINNEKGLNLAKILLCEVGDSNLRPTQRFKLALDEIKSWNQSNKIAKDQYHKIQFYVNKRQLQAMSYFETNGILPEQYNILLAGFDFNVKKKKFMIKTSLVNTQYVMMIQKIANDDKMKITSKAWDMKWGSQQIMCYDYVWNKNKY